MRPKCQNWAQNGAILFCFFLVCLFVFHIAGVVYYQLLLKRETRIPGVALLFLNRNLESFCA